MKAFRCALCEAAFSTKKTRVNHMKTAHPNDYYCIQCNNQYLTSSLYTKHMKTAHDEDVPLVIDKVIDIPMDKLLFAPHVAILNNVNSHLLIC